MKLFYRKDYKKLESNNFILSQKIKELNRQLSEEKNKTYELEKSNYFNVNYINMQEQIIDKLSTELKAYKCAKGGTTKYINKLKTEIELLNQTITELKK